MQIEKQTKIIDYTKRNIGVELECFLVHSDTLREISQKESQTIFTILIKHFRWKKHTLSYLNEIHAVSKTIHKLETIIKIDLCYAIFEITTPPVPSLQELEHLIFKALTDLRGALSKNNCMVWPFGVAPASTGLLKLPFKHREEIVYDQFYRPLMRLEYQPRFCHITSHQVNIDVPLVKLIPTINALYKNLGEIIEKFANCPVYANGRLYKEGRYYWWNDRTEYLNTSQYRYGGKPIFPDAQFKNLTDFYFRIWHGEFVFVMRNSVPHIFKDKTMTVHRFLQEKKGVVLDPNNKEVTTSLTKEDIKLFFLLHWLDFKPHFDFKQFTLHDFLQYYYNKNLDGFFAKYCVHCFLEIRPCSPHFENNAIYIPRYFYDIFENLDEYIKNAKKISWKEARKRRNSAIFDGRQS